MLENEDFEDDKKDAGELGINQNITALYEVVLKNNGSNSNPLCKVNLRYKAPESDVSIPMSLDIFDKGATFENASPQMIFTSSVASFGLLLNNSNYKGTANYDAINGWLDKTTSLPDKHGLNKEFKELVMKAKSLQR